MKIKKSKIVILAFAIIAVIMTFTLAACDEKVDNAVSDAIGDAVSDTIGDAINNANADVNSQADKSQESDANDANDAPAENPAPLPSEPQLDETPPVIISYEGGFSASLEMQEVVDSLEAGDIEQGMAIINEAFERTFVVEETKPNTNSSDSSNFGDIFSRGMDDLIDFGSQLITGMLEATGGSTIFDVTKVLEAVADGNMDAGTALLMDVGMSYVVGAVTDALIGPYLAAFTGSPTSANLADIYRAINDAQEKLTVIADMKR
jgi:hypothetical protein